MTGFALLNTWIGYYYVLMILDKYLGSDECKKEIVPFVTVLVVAHNEEKSIVNRINNLLNIDYPLDYLDIIVVSDGSNDQTDQLIKNISEDNSRIRYIRTEGGGKSLAQNMAIPDAKGEIIILTDAETIFRSDAIRKIVRNFYDDRVGCVSGKVTLITQQTTIAEGHGMYWKYEMKIRGLESRLRCLHTASGSIMAIRKSLFKPFKCKYGDDCIIPLNIIKSGYWIVHEDQAIAYDSFPITAEGELKSRIRMTIRNITCTLSNYEILNPSRHPLLSYAVFSHKLLRWLSPFLLIIFFIANLPLKNAYSFYRFIFYTQISFYGLGFLGYICYKRNFRLPVASQIFSFLLANTGFFVGVLKALQGQKILSYKK